MATKTALAQVISTLENGGTLKDALNLVSGQTGIAVGALRSSYYSSLENTPRAHGNARLSHHDEHVLVAVAQAFSLNNFPLNNAQIRGVIKRRWDIEVSQPWVSRWVQRNRQHLSLRACKAFADMRAGPEVLDGAKAFCGELEKFLETHSFIPSAVFNYDETRITHRGGKMASKRVEASAKTRTNSVATRKSTVASLLSFVLASGSVFMSVYVLKANLGESSTAPVDVCLHDAPRTSRRCWPRFYCWTETGFLTGEAFDAVMAKFSDEWATRNPGIPSIFFGDQLGVHRQPDIIEPALDKSMHLFFHPRNTSHITQPLDEAPIGVFQRLVATGAQQGVIDGMLGDEGTRNALIEAAYAAESRAFLPNVIIGVFRRCGLWPSDPERMLSQVADALGLGHTDSSTRGVSRAAAADVIHEATSRAKAAKTRTSTGSTVVQRAVLHAPDALLEQSKEIAANKASDEAVKAARAISRAHKQAKKSEKESVAAAARVANLCRVCATRTYRGGKGWSGCGCGRFRVCPGCTNSMAAAEVLSAQLEECPGEVSDRSNSRGDEDSEE